MERNSYHGDYVALLVCFLSLLKFMRKRFRTFLAQDEILSIFCIHILRFTEGESFIPCHFQIPMSLDYISMPTESIKIFKWIDSLATLAPSYSKEQKMTQKALF